MALLSKDFTQITSIEDWESFFIEELKLSTDDAQQYAEEFHSLKLTGSNIGIGLTKPDFLNHVNIPFGHLLELEARFTNKVKVETTTQRPPVDKVPRPTIGMNTSQLGFDQFKFEWYKYKQHYQLTSQESSTSLFFCCTDEVRNQIRVLQSPSSSTWTEGQLMDSIKDIVMSKTSPIVHTKQYLELKQESIKKMEKIMISIYVLMKKTNTIQVLYLIKK